MTLRQRVFPLPLLKGEKLLEGMGSGSRLALGRWHLAEADRLYTAAFEFQGLGLENYVLLI